MPSRPLTVGDASFDGTVTCRQLNVTQASITGSMLVSGANLAPTQMAKGRRSLNHKQVPGTAVVAETTDLHIVFGTSGTLVGLQASITGAIATGADRTVDVDLQKSTGAAAFATVLTGTIHFTNASVLRVVSSGTFSATGLVAGDILRLVITVAGAAGNQAQGLIITLTYDESPT